MTFTDRLKAAKEAAEKYKSWLDTAHPLDWHCYNREKEHKFRSSCSVSFTLELIERYEALEKAVQYYAAHFNWKTSTEVDSDPKDRVTASDIDGVINPGEDLCGGRMARATLKELGE